VHDSNWIPLTWLSLLLDTTIYGGRPGGYHLTNAFVHSANTVLLFLALVVATGARAKSAVVAALFALHPLHVESVAWVSERKDVLSTLFGFLSLLAYVRYVTRGGASRLAASFLLFVLSLLAKPTLVTWPFVYLLLDFWPLGRLSLGRGVLPANAKTLFRGRAAGRRIAAGFDPPRTAERRPVLWLIVEKVPFFAASALFSAIAVLVQSNSGAVMTLEGFSLSARCTNAIYVYIAYLGKTIFPQDLAFYYPHPHESLGWTACGLAAGLLLGISAVAIAFVRRFPFLFVGWFWYLGTLVPMIGIVQIGAQQMADRYTYVPLIGIFLALSWLVPELVPLGFLRQRALPAAVMASLVLLAATAYSQITYWHDSITLLRHSMECTQDSAASHEFLGWAYLEAGSDREAAEELEKVCRMVPEYLPTHLSLGSALLHLGRLDDATAQFRQALALDPQSTDAHNKLGLIFLQRGQFEDAKRHFLRVLEIDPEFVSAHVNLGSLFFRTADYAGAIAQSEQALRLQPDLPSSQLCIGMALREQGHLDDAITRFQHVVELTPDDPFAREQLALTLAKKQDASKK
jgi:tetratricopeptide (TPR) repeat protein